ncbi:Ig-specific serine endopeptidase MIP [Ureaplasma canigenitalium]|uniref:Ig-specific serine endopeptidase MIP n=1 Tax=Ureaplasma canigenitalium TaxID=42092 RepID=UPI0004E22C67|nr:DUF31 family protein [Ureaplasma canigenitalium]
MKLKKKTKTILALSFSLIGTIPLIAAIASCTNNKKDNDSANGEDTKKPETGKDGKNKQEDKQGDQKGGSSKDDPSTKGQYSQASLQKLVDSYVITLKSWGQPPRSDKANTFANDVNENIVLEITNLNPSVVDYFVNRVVETEPSGVDKSVKTGILKLAIVFSYKDAPSKALVTKTVEFSGFKTSSNGIDSSGIIYDGSYDSLKHGNLQEYVGFNQKQRYHADSEKYIGQLRRYWEQSGGLNQVRPEVDLTNKGVQKFNTEAEKIGIDKYEDLATKGFSIPQFDEQGNYLGLSLYNAPEAPKKFSWVDVGLGGSKRDENKINGLARTLPNEHYRTAALQTLALNVNNIYEEGDERPSGPVVPGKSTVQTRGTVWILDYLLPSNETITEENYPTKWFFGTNEHVASKIKPGKTVAASLSIIKRDNSPLGTTFDFVETDKDRFITVPFETKDKDDLIFNVYTGLDYLYSNPSDYLYQKQKDSLKDKKEFIDFAVVGVDFEKIYNSLPDSTKHEYKSAAHLAYLFTNGYALPAHKDEQIKLPSETYLKNYEKIDFPLAKNSGKNLNDIDQIFILGYPRADHDFFLSLTENDKYTNAEKIKIQKESASLWINSEYSLYGQLSQPEGTPKNPKTEETAKRGNYLSYNVGYRSFIEKPGLADLFIALPRVGPKYYQDANKKEYIQTGLAYIPRHFAPFGGSSGSSVRNQNNELFAVYGTSNFTSHTGVAFSLRSEGYDYKEAFGNKYHLPQYDLIYGGGLDQKTSYREALYKIAKEKNWYSTGSSTAEAQVKSNLFQNGTSVDQIPEKYKFNDQFANGPISQTVKDQVEAFKNAHQS